MNDDVIT